MHESVSECEFVQASAYACVCVYVYVSMCVCECDCACVSAIAGVCVHAYGGQGISILTENTVVEKNLSSKLFIVKKLNFKIE